ncbi:unnamed protein product, partial [Protopolystoma xenopodis]
NFLSEIDVRSYSSSPGPSAEAGQLQPVPSVSSGSRLMLRPHVETISWLGLPPPRTAVTPMHIPGHHTFDSAKPLAGAPIGCLAGLHRLCELIVRVYVDNPPTPRPNTIDRLLSSELNDAFMRNLSEAGASSASHLSDLGTIDATGVGASCAMNVLNPEITEMSQQQQQHTLRSRLQEAMCHLCTGWWNASAAFIACVSSLAARIANYLSQNMSYLPALRIDTIYCSVNNLENNVSRRETGLCKIPF